ncbi:ankyrin repeat domain-containing protein 66-like isoform X1 [Rhopilema esculentum]|uniref:ankyrin repeat domain-containing protein 66-like isoform X1 n=1 Tax=Rhopilema esculentum TaxID=499914 RepID=UPI0031D9E127
MSTRKNSSLITHELLLHDAASQGDERKLDDLKVFVKRGKFDINFKDEDWGSRTALHCASERGHLRCCKFLLEGGADPSARMSMGWTPAHCAAEGGHLSVIRLLAESGGTVNAKDDYGDTPKMIAVRYGHKECTEYLQSIEHFPEQRKELLKETFQYAIKKKIKENQMASKTNGE